MIQDPCEDCPPSEEEFNPIATIPAIQSQQEALTNPIYTILARQSTFGQNFNDEDVKRGIQSQNELQIVSKMQSEAQSGPENIAEEELDLEDQVLDTIETVENVLVGVTTGTVTQSDAFRALISGLANMRGVLSQVMSTPELTQSRTEAENEIKMCAQN